MGAAVCIIQGLGDASSYGHTTIIKGPGGTRIQHPPSKGGPGHIAVQEDIRRIARGEYRIVVGGEHIGFGIYNHRGGYRCSTGTTGQFGRYRVGHRDGCIGSVGQIAIDHMTLPKHRSG